MSTYEQELACYRKLNAFARPGNTVLFGGRADRELPLAELLEAFGLDETVYNRSLSQVSVENAIEAYDACVAPLAPSCLLLHLGEAETDPEGLNTAWLKLLSHIRRTAPKCELWLLGPRDGGKDLARRLRALADSGQCDYLDLSKARLWTPAQSRECHDFIHLMGVRRKPSGYDLARAIFSEAV